jgi:hypothetical protein
MRNPALHAAATDTQTVRLLPQSRWTQLPAMTEAHPEGEAMDVADTADVAVAIEVDGTETEMDVAATAADGMETAMAGPPDDRPSKPQPLPSSPLGPPPSPQSERPLRQV